MALLARTGLPGSGVQGSGVAATQSRLLPTFSSLDLAGSNNVTVAIGGRQSVVVHADSNLIRYVTTRVAAGTLVIGTTGSFTTRSPMSVEVSVPSLAAVTLSGSGKISLTGIDAPRLTVMLPGSGRVYAAGTVTQLDVNLGGSGLAQLDSLAARDVHAVVAGSGLIRVTATGSLNAAVTGSGAIIYGGNPQVTSSVTGSGTVTRG
ncbi:MAG TPA: head GIN domain-containing protein [Streptosporangiaceae bacterium]|nr:head GIN domain-containing protein [Streptosporangiaceae bacterium]